MKNIILFGNTNFTKLIKHYLENDERYNVIAATVEEKYINNTNFEGLSLIPFEKIEYYYPLESFEILICIGYREMNQIRKKIFEMCENKKIVIASYIHPSVRIDNSVEIGVGNIILENTTIQPFTKIGKGNLIWYNVAIAHDSIIGNFNTLTGMASICGNVVVKNNCFIGNNSTIRDGIVIEDFSLIGAGAYICNNTEKYDVYTPSYSIKLSKKSYEMNL